MTQNVVKLLVQYIIYSCRSLAIYVALKSVRGIPFIDCLSQNTPENYSIHHYPNTFLQLDMPSFVLVSPTEEYVFPVQRFH